MKNIEIGKMVLQKLEENGFEAYFIGGTSRDILLNNTVNDIDITTNAKPEEVIVILNDYKIKNKDGIFYGTVKYCIDSVDIEITSFRKEDIYVKSRRPMKVEFIDSKEIDSLRRDFTINAIYMNYKGEIFDFHNGIKDLKNGIIKMIGDPKKRLKEDALRMLRAIRFSLDLNMQLDQSIIDIIRENSHLILDLKEKVIIKEINKLKNKENLDRIIKELNIDLGGVLNG